MSHLISKFMLIAMLAVPSLAQVSASDRPQTSPASENKPPAAAAKQSKPSKPKTHSTKRNAKRAKRHTRPQQPYKIAPMTPELLPAAPPQVSYLNGQLTIQSENSTLADILAAVGNRTGAEMDVPPGFGSERVATRLGPGSASDVLNALLSGSKFGYVLVGATDSPGTVQKIIITGKESALAASNAAPPPAAANNRADWKHGNKVRIQSPRGVNPEAEADDNADVEAEAPPPEPPPPPPPAQTGESTPPSATMPAPAPGMTPQVQPGQPQAPGQPQVKTPEQLLQELQRMRNQQGAQSPQQ